MEFVRHLLRLGLTPAPVEDALRIAVVLRECQVIGILLHRPEPPDQAGDDAKEEHHDKDDPVEHADIVREVDYNSFELMQRDGGRWPGKEKDSPGLLQYDPAALASRQ